MNLVLRLDAFSPDLIAEMGRDLLAVKAPVEAAFKGNFLPWQFERQAERLDAIAPILAIGKWTAERTAAFAKAAAQPRLIGGKITFFADKTLREWVGLYERGGAAALMPAARAGRGRARVLITRKWDNGIDLDAIAKAKITEDLAHTARSLIANDDASILELMRVCADKLANMCQKAGSHLRKHQLSALCQLNSRWAEDFREYRLVYMNNKDRKRLYNPKTPYVERDLHPVPMGLVIGDVHCVDLEVKDNEKPVRVRLIAWMDASSGFVWATAVFLGKGGGFTQEDVTESLWQLCSSPHGGIPLGFSLDNGTEYKAMVGAVQRLSTMAQIIFNVSISEPYRPRGKGLVEGSFHIDESIFKGIDGYIGGDRTNKLSAQMGQVVAPYRKGLAALKREIQDGLAIYNDRPQHGRLKGLSPLQMLEKKIKETGLVARQPDLEAFDIMFNKADVRAIQSGGHILINNQRYYGPCLDTLLRGDKVDVLIPSREDAGRIFVRQGARDLGWANQMQVYASGDRQGARDQAAMEKGMIRKISALEAQTSPDIRLFPMQVVAITQRAPNAPEPEVWGAGGLGVIDKTALKSPEKLEAEEDARRWRDLNYFLGIDTQEKREANGGNRWGCNMNMQHQMIPATLNRPEFTGDHQLK